MVRRCRYDVLFALGATIGCGGGAESSTPLVAQTPVAPTPVAVANVRAALFTCGSFGEDGRYYASDPSCTTGTAVDGTWSLHGGRLSMTGESQTIEAEEVAGEDEPTLVFAPPKSVAWSMQVARVWAEADEVSIAGHDDTGWVMMRCGVGPSGAPAEAPEPGQWVELHGDGAALWSSR